MSAMNRHNHELLATFAPLKAAYLEHEVAVTGLTAEEIIIYALSLLAHLRQSVDQDRAVLFLPPTDDVHQPLAFHSWLVASPVSQADWFRLRELGERSLFAWPPSDRTAPDAPVLRLIGDNEDS